MAIELNKPPDADHPAGTLEFVQIGDQEVIVRYAHIPDTDFTLVRGIPCTTPLRTVIDIAPDNT